MIGLLILGRLIEALYGPARFLAIYVLSCVAGVGLSYLLTPETSLGASTGVMGLMGALLVHNLKYRHHFPERLRWIFPFLLIMLVAQFSRDVMSQGVDLWGHVGGLLGGMVMAWLLAGRLAGSAQQERDWLPLPTAVLTASVFLLYGGYGLLTTLPQEMDLLRAGMAENFFLAGQRAFLAGQYQSAAALYRQSMEYALREDLRTQVYNSYAWTLADKLNRDLDEAERYAQLAVRAAPANPAIADTLAWVYYRQGRYQEALGQQLAAVSLAEPGRPAEAAELHFHLGAIQEALRRNDEARQSYGKALQLQPRDAAVREEITRRLRRLENVPLPQPGEPAPESDPAAARGII
jgi:tetratricopeptide (TPR) repeat protein